MRRPSVFWCGIVLSLAVAAGCSSKKKTDSESNSNATPAPAAGSGNRDQSQGRQPQPPSPGQNGTTSGDQATGLFAGVVKTDGGTNTNAEATTPEATEASGEPTPGGSGAVELVQCRFERVEKALTAAKGKVILVDCWARWCPPCIQSFPKLVEKHEKYAAKGLTCISVSLDSGRNQFKPDQVHAFLKEKKATFQNYYLTDLRSDNAAMTGRFGQIDGIPHAVLFNKKGTKIWEGHPMEPTLVSKIEAELAK